MAVDRAVGGLVASAGSRRRYLLFGKRRPQSLTPGAKRVDQAMSPGPALDRARGPWSPRWPS